MAMTPCQRHRARMKAAKALDKCEALTASPVSFHIQMLELARDVERLRSLTRAERIDMKRDVLLPRWMPTVEAYLAGDARFANPALVYCVIWLFDTGEMGKALDWADVAISESQATPENFKSNLPAFVADTVLEWAIMQAEAGHSIEPYFTARLKTSAKSGVCTKTLTRSGSSSPVFTCCATRRGSRVPLLWMM